ncbi:MAG TPA: hypothetical protein VGI12_07585 [Vicinamibacterales bacterium]|jgi:hypothetical protein
MLPVGLDPEVLEPAADVVLELGLELPSTVPRISTRALAYFCRSLSWPTSVNELADLLADIPDGGWPLVPVVEEPVLEPDVDEPPTIALVSIQPRDAELVLELPLVPVAPVELLAPEPGTRQPVTVTVFSLRLLLWLPFASCGVGDCAAAVHTASANAAAVPNTCERFINMPPKDIFVQRLHLQTSRRRRRP